MHAKIHLGMKTAGLFFAIFAGAIWTGCGSKQELPPQVRDSLLEADAGLKEQLSAEQGLDTAPQTGVVKYQVNNDAWIDETQLPWTLAEVHYLRGGRVGYSILNVTKSEISDFNLLKIQRTDVIDRAPDGSPIPPKKVIYDAFERPNGELASFQFRSTVDGQPDLEVEGRVIFDNMELTRKELDEKQRRQKLPWSHDIWGPHGIQSLLMRSPMSPGEVREVQFFLPQLSQFVSARLEAIKVEATPLTGTATPELLKIDVQIGTAESGVHSQIWTDDQGVIQKTATLTGEPILKIRVDTGTVKRLADQSHFGRMVQKQIELSGDTSKLTSTNSLVVEIQSIELDPFGKFLKTNRQDLRSLNASTCQITTGQRADTPLEPEDHPDTSYLAASPIIPSNLLPIEQLAGQLLRVEPSESPGETTDEADQNSNEASSEAEEIKNDSEGASTDSVESIAERLRVQLHQRWTTQPISAEIKSTLVAARSRAGSSIECASVLAALLRHQQIPARLVGGLLMDSDSHKVRFHVWTQAWLEGAWHDMDAILADSVGPYHLAMVTSDASGDNPYQSWIPALEAFQEILELRVK